MAILVLGDEAANSRYVEAFMRLVSRRDSLHYKASKLIAKAGVATVSDVARGLGVSYHKAWRILKDLEALGVVGEAGRRGGEKTYAVRMPLHGALRLFEDHTVPQLIVSELASALSSYLSASWLLKLRCVWRLSRLGLAEYVEHRRYLKLSARPPRVTYVTVYGEGDDVEVSIACAGRELKPRVEGFDHPLRGLRIARAVVDQDLVCSEYGRLPIGGELEVVVKDRVRIYACRAGRGVYRACFAYRVRSHKLHVFDLELLAPRALNPREFELWYDDALLVARGELKGRARERTHRFTWEANTEGGVVRLRIRGESVMMDCELLRLIVVFEPRYEGDVKSWILLGDSAGCPSTCTHCPTEMIHPH